MNVQISLPEIADAICRGHLAGYADPKALHKDDGANQYGIVVEYSESRMAIRFSFIPRDFPEKLITLTVEGEKFASDPSGMLAGIHYKIHETLDNARREESPIWLPSGVSQAVSKEIH